jgi:transglutaminase-like putative cysteine protease
MPEQSKPADAVSQYRTLASGGVEYLYMGAAIAVPLFTSGRAIQQDAAGALLVFFAWLGLAISYLTRSIGVPSWGRRNIGWIQLVIACLSILMGQELNSRLPGGGFPWQLAPAAFLCWYIVLGSYFVWTDEAMLFLLVPGVALFGVQSYIETAGGFEISLVLFMVSVAVVLTRLHLRFMIASARAAGYRDEATLFRGPWRAMAGPVLAVVSVLLVGGASVFLAPGIGDAVRKLAGEPELKFEPPRFGSSVNAQETVKKIGQGPISSSNQVVLRVRTKDRFDYLRGHPYRFYRGNGWSEDSNYSELQPSNAPPESEIPDAVVYAIPDLPGLEHGSTVRAEVECVSRSHEFAYSPGQPERIEYNGEIMIFRREFPVLRDAFPRRKKYYVRARLSTPSPGELRGAPPTDRQEMISYYSQPSRDRVSRRVIDLARTIAGAQPTDYDAVLALKDEVVKRCKYNLRAEAIEGDRDRVDAFLFETNEGYCDLFASALAVMCRSAGLRARVVTGYIVHPDVQNEGVITLRDRDFHMWTQVFFDGFGWVDFDATDSAEMVPGGELGALVQEENSQDAPWVAYAGVSIFSLAALALVAGVFVSWLRNRKPLPENLRKLRAFYLDFLALLKKNGGRPRYLSETIAEYAAASSIPAAVTVGSLFERALYAQDLPTPEQIAEIGEGISKLAKEVNGNGR